MAARVARVVHMDTILSFFQPKHEQQPTSHLQEMVANATDALRGSHVDWDLTLEICDIARGAPEQTADVLEGIKKRLAVEGEPAIALLSLTLLEALRVHAR